MMQSNCKDRHRTTTETAKRHKTASIDAKLPERDIKQLQRDTNDQPQTQNNYRDIK